MIYEEIGDDIIHISKYTENKRRVGVNQAINLPVKAN
jgi:hypothetical protein